MINSPKILIINLNDKEKNLMNNIFNNIHLYFNTNIVDASNINFKINLYNEYIYIYDKYLVNNDLFNNSKLYCEKNGLILLNSTGKVKSEIEIENKGKNFFKDK
jgi:hypothetical protein